MNGRRHRVLLVLVAALLAVAGCGTRARFVQPGAGPSSAGHGPDLGVSPADKATGVPVSAEVSVASGPIGTVQLTDAAGRAVPGAPRADGSSWVPDDPLNYTTTYTLKVTAAGKGTETTSFTTMASPPDRLDAHLYMSDGATYGQAMPLVVEFKAPGIAPADRAAVERRLFVQSTPAQVGAWHWDSDTQVEYRSKDYWQPGTKIHGRLAIGGLPLGGGRYGKQDITIDATIDTVRREIKVDDHTKQLVAVQDGQVVKTAPASLGKPDKPSFSGTMVIMERLDKTTFDSSTYGTPVNSPDGYRTEVQFAERLTWDGQFIHAAPWSVAQQGHTDVSHGCVNISTDNGQWIYNWVKVGDPVTVANTGRPLNQGNGWTAWNMSWDDFVKGSALTR